MPERTKKPYVSPAVSNMGKFENIELSELTPARLKMIMSLRGEQAPQTARQAEGDEAPSVSHRRKA
ncbi:hypothetical protein GCM10009127_01190 [Alteraurantiacibacter aestuarii]